jgi:hypothetical protein
MKCANPDCNHGIGLVSYRRGFLGKRPYCSKQCRDRFVAERIERPAPNARPATYFEWLFMQPAAPLQPKLALATARARLR